MVSHCFLISALWFATSALPQDTATGAELPLNGRRYTDLALRTPGVTQDSSWPHFRLERCTRLRRHPRISVQLPGGQQRRQQWLSKRGPRTLSRALPVLQRSGAGVPHFFGSSVTDLRITRRVYAADRLKLELMAESFNLLNRQPARPDHAGWFLKQLGAV